jgi:hypothetical protein
MGECFFYQTAFDWELTEVPVEAKGLFGTAHDGFMSYCELFFVCQTLISKTVHE